VAFRVLSSEHPAHIGHGSKGHYPYEGATKDIEYVLTECPLCFAERQTLVIINGDDAFSLYADYKNGILPYSRGFHEHPARYVDAMRLLRKLDNQVERQRLDKAKKDHG